MIKNYKLKLVSYVLMILQIAFLTISTLVAEAHPFGELNEEGGAVPDVTLEPMEAGKPEVTFKGQKGKPFIVVFWGADLPEKIDYSAKILSELEGLAPFFDERNVLRYSVNVQDDESTAINEVLSKSKSTLELYKDKNQQAYSLLGIYVIPAVLLVDKEGDVVTGMGYSRDIVDRLKGSVEIMLGEKTAEQVAAELRPEMKEASDEAKASRRHFNFGMVMKKHRQYDSAIREFSKAGEIDPNMSEAYLQLGCLYMERKELENAEVAINKVLEDTPESVKGRICRGELLWLKGQFSDAVELLQQVISDHPDRFDAHYYLGRTLADMKNDKEAMENYKKAYMLILKYSVK